MELVSASAAAAAAVVGAPVAAAACVKLQPPFDGCGDWSLCYDSGAESRIFDGTADKLLSEGGIREREGGVRRIPRSVLLRSDDVCLVGFALNPKKMRKSGAEAESQEKVDGGSGWRGGGLGDILLQHDQDGAPVVEGVTFCPWDWQTPQALQVAQTSYYLLTSQFLL
jgi:hypothetical protein